MDKYCADCVHYREHMHTCTREHRERDLVTGKLKYFHRNTYNERAVFGRLANWLWGDRCGPEGQYFQRKGTTND